MAYIALALLTFIIGGGLAAIRIEHSLAGDGGSGC
jgi:hypothetical protein